MERTIESPTGRPVRQLVAFLAVCVLGLGVYAGVAWWQNRVSPGEAACDQFDKLAVDDPTRGDAEVFATVARAWGHAKNAPADIRRPARIMVVYQRALVDGSTSEYTGLEVRAAVDELIAACTAHGW